MTTVLGVGTSLTSAAVMTGRRHMEVREFPLPPVGADDGLLEVEATGVCGSDVGFYNQDLSPRVLGHETVGTIARIGPLAAKRWGVTEGDRVVLEEYLPCGHCRFCRSSEFRLCLEADPSATPGALRYGSTPLGIAPGLWGGYGQHLYLHPNTVAHRLAPGVPAVEASLALPLGNGYEWAYVEGGIRPGSTVVIMGPGQQGLGCVIAAREAGAGLIIVTGLRRDAARLEVAKSFGAHHTIFVDDIGLPRADLPPADLRQAIVDITGPALVDVVIDAAVGNEATLSVAFDILAKRGTLVLPVATMRPLTELDLYKVTRRYLTVKGVRGHSYAAVEWAIALISSGRYPLKAMCSLEVGLDAVERAILGTAGELDTEVIHAAVVPGSG
jgi:threonine dehydrogenase-like Zn-dependent dehydrogenase